MKKLLQLIFKLFFNLKKSHFLIVLQNNNELRSTGGYITAVLDLTLGQWRVENKFLNVNTDLCKHEKVEAPKIIQEMLFDGHLNTWTFRDANYDPDFEKSAKKMAEFYGNVYSHQKIGGILAVNFSFIEELLDILGAIKIENDWIDAHCLFEYLTTTVSDIDRHDKKQLGERKNILQKLGKKIIFTLAKKPWKYINIIRRINKKFKSKDLQLYDPNLPNTAFKIEEGEDFFALIENNYLGLKSNRYIHRSVQHHSTMEDGGNLKNKVSILWKHFGLFNYPVSGNYRAHIRIYLSKEAILKPSETYEIEREDEFTILSFRILLGPKESKEINFEYALPTHFHEKKYQFKFFKQSGVKNESLQKTFSLPLNMNFVEVEEAQWNENIAYKSYCETSKDILFKLAFKKNKNHPRVYGHEVVSNNSILIKFNEAVKIEKAEVEIWEKDEPKNKMEIHSLKLMNAGKWILIELKEIPENEEKFFTVRIKDIVNENGISITPNPRNLTAVYRSKYFKYWEKQIPELKKDKGNI